jgi:uncharacterized protein YecE (DUF72 family)
MLTFVGTSGWDYPHWRGVFYPSGCPRSGWLDHYTHVFSTVEVNATFYRRIRPETLERWRTSTPEGFLWAVKASRLITHLRKLKGVENALETFLSDISLLGDKLGGVLFQLPPSLEFDPGVARAFLSLLPGVTRYALEARHPSWTSSEALSLLETHGIAWCIADTAGRYPYLEALTAGHAYVRLHGSRQLYASEYTLEELKAWAARIRSWGRDTFVYFDNDFMGHAPKNALILKELLG